MIEGERSITLEVQKIAFKQTKEGNVVTLRIQPDDNSTVGGAAIAIMPLGSILKITVTDADVGA